MSDWFDHLPNHPANDDRDGFYYETETAKSVCIVCGGYHFEGNDAYCSDYCESMAEEFGED